MGQDDPPNYDAATLVAVPLDGLDPLSHHGSSRGPALAESREAPDLPPIGRGQPPGEDI